MEEHEGQFIHTYINFKIFTALPMLFHVNTILTDFYWCFHVHNVKIALLKHMSP